MRVDVVITRGTGATTSERVVPAELVGIVAELDLAVLRVDAESVPALRLSRARVRPGDRTLTVAPGGPNGPALAEGVVLATGAPVREDAPVPYLISSAAQSVAGAPLFNEAGEVIGLAAAFMDEAGATATAALPAALLQAALTQLTSPMPWQRGVVGLTAQRMMPVDDTGRTSPSDARLLVAAVASGMPADKAGVRSGDVIVSVNDQPVNGMELATLYLALYTLRAGQPLHLGLERDGRFIDLKPTAVSMRDVIASQ
jgi:serine protease Do